jgi:hypothetical protein
MQDQDLLGGNYHQKEGEMTSGKKESIRTASQFAD